MVELLIFLGIGWLIIVALRGKKTPAKQQYSASKLSSYKESSDFSVSVKLNVGGRSYETDRQPVQKKNVRWVKPGESITIDGHTITDGFVYVGSIMSADIDSISALNNTVGLGVQSHSYSSNWMGQRTIEPALINPSLRIAAHNPDTNGEKMGHWPSYSSIEPECRLAYLQWLADGKKSPNACIGYVFLYFYGIERRIIADRPEREEMLVLISEVERLRSIYSANRSFDGYSTKLLDAANLIMTWRDIASLETIVPAIDHSPETERMRQLVALALKMKDASPLSFAWAMVGYFYAAGWQQRIAATRARPMFLALMQKRFEKKWPQGLKLRQRKSQFSYYFQGASQYLRLNLAETLRMHSLPNPQDYDWSKLTEMAGKVENDLAAYARAVGRDPSLASSPKAIPLLPVELATEYVTKLSAPLMELLAGHHTPLKRIRIADLVPKITGAVPTSLDLKTLRNTAEVMAHMGYGMEPDPDFGRIRPALSDNCIIFDVKDLKNPRAKASEGYTLAMSMVMLVAGVAGASSDGMGQEVTRWLGWITKTLNIGDAESRRLHAHLMWLCEQKLTLAQVKRALTEVPEHQRHTIAYLAASVAAADGVIEKGEVAFLEKIYDELAIERSKLYSTLHELAATGAVPATEPITVEKSNDSVGKFKIKQPPDKQVAVKSQKLDASRINKRLEETHQVSSVLTTIFAVEEESAASSSVVTTSTVDQRFAGLDKAYAALVQRLLAQSEWERNAFEAIARELGLMPDGALEAMNEWAFERFDEAFAEDGDVIAINRTLIEEIDEQSEAV
jgi:uncharacterized tellurite resistance protein B-like protein